MDTIEGTTCSLADTAVRFPPWHFLRTWLIATPCMQQDNEGGRHLRLKALWSPMYCASMELK